LLETKEQTWSVFDTSEDSSSLKTCVSCGEEQEYFAFTVWSIS